MNSVLEIVQRLALYSSPSPFSSCVSTPFPGTADAALVKNRGSAGGVYVGIDGSVCLERRDRCKGKVKAVQMQLYMRFLRESLAENSPRSPAHGASTPPIQVGKACRSAYQV